jgi:5-methylcytosine-specific restriction endonuclease McrA
MVLADMEIRNPFLAVSGNIGKTDWRIQGLISHTHRKLILKMTTPTPPHFRDRNEWSAIPETEVERLQGTLRNHLRPMNVEMSKPDRIEFVRTLLAKQNQTCAFGKNVAGMYCWNHTKDNYANGMYTEKTYLKLEWGHIKPRSRKEEQTVHDLFLLCARCNNHIQSSRRLEQIKAELLSKIEHIDSIMSSASS